jgi:hypothetical protein
LTGVGVVVGLVAGVVGVAGAEVAGSEFAGSEFDGAALTVGAGPDATGDGGNSPQPARPTVANTVTAAATLDRT